MQLMARQANAYFLPPFFFFFFLPWRMGKNNAYAPTLPRIRYVSCFELTHAAFIFFSPAAAKNSTCMKAPEMLGPSSKYTAQYTPVYYIYIYTYGTTAVGVFNGGSKEPKDPEAPCTLIRLASIIAIRA